MAVDRVVAALGGRALVATRPGIGYLVAEVIPAFVWTQLTGAVSLEFFYFIAYLKLLGISNAAMGYLPVMVCAAGVAQFALVLWHPPGDPRRRCVIDSALGRTIWLGTILWPLLGSYLHWSMAIELIGIYSCVFTTHLLCQVSNASFFTWTQTVVPPQLRGVFLGMRNFGSYLVVLLLLRGVAALMSHPGSSARTAGGELHALMLLLTGATVIGIAGVWVLSRGPTLSHGERTISYGPLLSRFSGNGPLLRLVLWTCLVTAASFLSMVYRPLIYLQNGADTARMASWQAWGQYPCMLLAILVVGWMLPRIHARRMLMITHLLMIAAEGSLLLLTPLRLAWMLPLLLCGFGLANGCWSLVPMTRQQELLPQGDPRFFALMTGIASLAGLMATLGLPQLVAFLERWSATHQVLNAPCLVVALGIGLRVVATPLLLGTDGQRAPTHPAAGASA